VFCPLQSLIWYFKLNLANTQNHQSFLQLDAENYIKEASRFLLVSVYY
jgi:hypothetical protein